MAIGANSNSFKLAMNLTEFWGFITFDDQPQTVYEEKRKITEDTTAAQWFFKAFEE